MNTPTGVVLRFCAIGLLFALGSACSRPGGDGSGTDAVAAYGYGPDPDGGAEYQRDVVLIGGGSQAIRSESADGLTWLIDGAAAGARDLAVDKVMFVTSRAVGRIVRLERRGTDVAVTLAPVNLTEIVREADVHADLRIDPQTMSFRHVPDLLHSSELRPAFLHGAPPQHGFMTVSAVSRAEAADDWVITTEPLYLQGTARPVLTPVVDSRRSLKGGAKVNVEGFDVSLSMEGGGGSESIGLGISRTAEPLKASIDFKLVAKNLRVRTHLPVQGGVLSPAATFVIDGLEALDIDFKMGSANGAVDNQKVRVEVPVEMFFDIPPSPETAGLPLVVAVKVKFLLTTAFSAKNSVLGASARYGLAGSIGYDQGKLVTPTFTVIRPMTSALKGVSVGANGIVFATEFKFQVGVGTRVTLAGPYGKLTASMGAALGSPLGLVRCSSVTLRIDTAAGVGIQLSNELGGVLQKLLGKKLTNTHDIAEHSSTLVNRTSVVPDVPLCKG